MPLDSNAKQAITFWSVVTLVAIGGIAVGSGVTIAAVVWFFTS